MGSVFNKKRLTGKNRTKSLIIKGLVIFLVIFLAFIGATTYQTISSGQKIFDNDKSILENIGGLIVNKDKPLRGENDDQINVLLLGQGGGAHEGPLLTDTIMVVSYKPSTKQIAMLSIPRDLYVETDNGYFYKINSLNALYENQEKRSGAKKTKEFLEGLLDIPTHYYARIDFYGFQKLIDELGGIDVYVDRSFYDPLYPNSNYGYEPVSFKQGWQKMDGETALKYVRSRKGNNGEGSDFRRSERQQKVLLAVKDKTLQLKNFINPSKISSLAEILGDSLLISFEPYEIIRGYNLAKDYNNDEKIRNIILGDEAELTYEETTKETGYGFWTNTDLVLPLMAQNMFSWEEIKIELENMDVVILYSSQEQLSKAKDIAETLNPLVHNDIPTIYNNTGIKYGQTVLINYSTQDNKAIKQALTNLLDAKTIDKNYASPVKSFIEEKANYDDFQGIVVSFE